MCLYWFSDQVRKVVRNRELLLFFRYDYRSLDQEVDKDRRDRGYSEGVISGDIQYHDRG